MNKHDIKWVKGWRGLPEAWMKIKIPSVTSIIASLPDPEYEQWVLKVGQEKVDEIMRLAGYRGTALHRFNENFIISFAKSKDPSEALKTTQTLTPKQLEKEKIPEDKINEGRDLFYKFYYSDYSNYFEDLIKTELPIYSPTLFYRGIIDIFYRERIFGLSVTDIKTSNGYIKKGSVKELKYFYQLGGYAAGMDEMLKDKGLTVKRSSILCINTKSDILQEIILDGAELEKYKTAFKTLVVEWHNNNNQSYLLNIEK